MKLDIVIFGLSITSSWGNGHAATYRALARALHRRGHEVTFIERDVPWYRDNRDFASADYCRIELYQDLPEAARRYASRVAAANLVVLGSFVPDGAAIGDWITSHARGVTAFYDIDTPITLAGLKAGTTPYLAASLIPRFDLYLSFTGGPLLGVIENAYGSPRARTLYCAAHVEQAMPLDRPARWALGYLGTYSEDRQISLQRLLLETARRMSDENFVVAGSQYPAAIDWPGNVERIEHVGQDEHAQFYGRQRFTLNLTRQDMRRAGYSPSVRLFEAASCGTPIITDRWPGLETLFVPGEEILVVDDTSQVVQLLNEMSESRRREIAAAAQRRVLQSHTPEHRARQLESYYEEVLADRRLGTQLEVVA